jgi:iron complex transport system ATP-binding protein
VSAPEGAPALHLAGVSVAYGPRVALQGIDLTVPRGQFLALTGPNGSGKSTLLRTGLGLVVPTSGSVTLFGSAVGELSVRERAHRVAWVPQAETLREDVPLDRYVLYGRYASHGTFGREGEADRALVAEALAQVGLSDRARDGVLELSGGERQRAVLARALAQRAPLVLLDEPTTHLDIGHQLDLLDRVRALVRDRRLTVVAALHDLNLAARYAERIVVLSRGRLVADGAPGAVLSSQLLERVWGVEAELRRDPASGLPYLLPRLAATPPEAHLPSPRVHVVAGGGSGAALLRALADRGFDVTAGVLPLFDTDATVAGELGIPAAVELPFSPIGPEALARFDRLVDEAEAVVVAPFPVGPGNLANVERLARVVRAKPIVLLAQPPGSPWDYAGGQGEEARRRLVDGGAVVVDGVAPAVDWLARRLAPRGPSDPPRAERDELDPQRA